MTQAKTLQNLAEKSSRFVAVSAPKQDVVAVKKESTVSVGDSSTLEELRALSKPTTSSLYVRSLVIVNGTFIVFNAEKNRAGLTLSLPSIRPKTTEDANDAAIRAFNRLDTGFNVANGKETVFDLGKSKTSVCLYEVSTSVLDSRRVYVDEQSVKYDGKTFVAASGYILFPVKRLAEIYAKKAVEKPFYIFEDRDDGCLSGEAKFAGHDQSILIKLRGAKVL